MNNNWIHLDFKGIMPGEARLIEWISWLADQGIDGLVLEYEDRMPWQTWPNTYRAGLSGTQWQHVITAARGRGMQVVPLIQTHGHLEWLLKHETYASWRENGCYNEICPQCEDVLPRMENWIDEVIAIHDGLEYLHIGGDETWNLATCPKCRAIADASDDGKLHVYIDYLCKIVERVAARGITPMIWADAFWREERMDLVERLPEKMILCDWQYNGTGPWETAKDLAVGGRTVIGCSGIRCSYDQAQVAAPQRERIDNVLSWHESELVDWRLHTTWGRGRSLLPCYGPWEGWLPAFLAAADPEGWQSNPIASLVDRFDSALTGSPKEMVELADELEADSFDDPMADSCRKWWALSLRWAWILHMATATSRTITALQAVNESIGIDPDYMNHRRVSRGRINESLAEWEQAVRAFFVEHDLSDVEEFITSRTNFVKMLDQHDWAFQTIPVAEPRTAR